ncbi:hypothetical protein EV361DRAFT_809262 [Lentinula raphanica]|nr:hypothetical protein EV361DRAFT_809262 [Lentinula raphanica]
MQNRPQALAHLLCIKLTATGVSQITQACILDLFRHLPRSIFSDAQMEIINWALSAFGIDNVPSVDVMKSVDRYLQSLCGIHTARYEGALGHIYYMNDLAGIIRQEMANPRVRPHIHHYHEDSGVRLEHAWQAEAWRDLHPDLATPMVRNGNQDFYTYEIAQLDNGELVLPYRWFTRRSGPQSITEFHGMAWKLQLDHQNHGYVVRQWDQVQFPATSLLVSFPRLVEQYEEDRLYDPCCLLGVFSILKQPTDNELSEWTYTDIAHGFQNRWRVQGKGHRVLTFAMWLYCDDTSGNVSKKWNKHNSFLFTAAGLPREHVHQQNNIHFLSTSNLAPPLEMLDGLVQQLDVTQRDGIWAWDIEAQEMVLIIPAVLAMLGDNPMQSEFACHVGLAGKYFCRCCWVKGRDAEDEGALPPRTVNQETGSTHSDVSSDGSVGSKRRRRQETLSELCERAQRFLKKHDLRHKKESVDQLKSIFTTSTKISGKTEAAKMVTQSGTKDTFLEHFRQKVFSFISKLPPGTTRQEKQQKVDDYVLKELPQNIYSPVWRIKGLDPHRDTPVEILHVVLLGFVKYYWRDALTRLSDADKTKLTHRLSSLDVSALGISALSGETYVKYGRSLTGASFRVIAQVAPFVLYDLLPKPCYESWLALSALIPLVWQPVIEDLETYLSTLEQAIKRFLHSAAAWTPRWFNKPKFHILIHLPMHIRRFGPAILYATEGFESFNAVIRDHSVHSNHQAPSRDIAQGFARCNRNRHLLSKGVFLRPELFDGCSGVEYFSDETKDWITAGPGPLALIRPRASGKSPVADAFGLNINRQCVVTSKTIRNCRSHSLKCFEYFPDCMGNVDPTSKQFNLFSSAVAADHERYSVGDFVLVAGETGRPSSRPIVARVVEIIQLADAGGPNNLASVVLVDAFDSTTISTKYGIPSLNYLTKLLVTPTDVLCHINVQHNCAGNDCDLSDTRIVREERENTGKTVPRTSHYNPSDLLLNTNQMRSGIYLQRLHPSLPPVDSEDAILSGATRELQEQKASKAAQKSSRTKKTTNVSSTSNLRSVVGQSQLGQAFSFS